MAVLETAHSIANSADDCRVAQPYPALVACTLDMASMLAEKSGMPVFVEYEGRPVTVFPKGTRPG